MTGGSSTSTSNLPQKIASVATSQEPIIVSHSDDDDSESPSHRK